MGDFQATFLNGINVAEISLATDEESINIRDASDYDLNTDAGHQRSDFDSYRKFSLRLPSQVVHIWSSDHPTTGNAIAPLPSSSDDAVIYSVSSGKVLDGVYLASLVSVPGHGAYVFSDGDCVSELVGTERTFYKCIQQTTGTEPVTDTAFWEVVSGDDVPEKYKAQAYFAITSAIEGCIEKLGDELPLISGTDVCLPDPFINKEANRYLMLMMIYEGIIRLARKSEWEKVKTLFSLSKKYCCC